MFMDLNEPTLPLKASANRGISTTIRHQLGIFCHRNVRNEYTMKRNSEDLKVL